MSVPNSQSVPTRLPQCPCICSPSLRLLSGSVLCVCAQLLSCTQPLQPHGMQPARLLCPWSFPSKSTGVGCHFLFQGVFPTQQSNPHLFITWIGRKILYHQAAWESCFCFVNKFICIIFFQILRISYISYLFFSL